MRRMLVTLAAVGGLALASAGPALAAECTTVQTSKGPLTAAQVGGEVTGPLNAEGCEVGVYYNAENEGGVTDATIEGASQYGIFVDGNAGNVEVNVTGSTIRNIGAKPFNGVQQGNAVYYYGVETEGAVSGTVRQDTISEYQKGGIVVNGEQASVQVIDNSVEGLGEVPFIAQNGVQFAYGAAGTISGNTITGNQYSGCSSREAAKTGCIPYVSTGLLLYDVNPTQVKHSHNHYRDDQRNLYLLPSAVLAP